MGVPCAFFSLCFGKISALHIQLPQLFYIRYCSIFHRLRQCSNKIVSHLNRQIRTKSENIAGIAWLFSDFLFLTPDCDFAEIPRLFSAITRFLRIISFISKCCPICSKIQKMTHRMNTLFCSHEKSHNHQMWALSGFRATSLPSFSAPPDRWMPQTALQQ